MKDLKQKAIKTEKMIRKLHEIIDTCIKHDKTEAALEAMMVCSHLLSSYILETDSFLENKVDHFSDCLIDTKLSDSSENKTILFYDGICNDARGLKLVYINALLNLGYKIIYVVDDRYDKFNGQKELEKLVTGKSFTIITYKYSREILPRINGLNDIVNQIAPSKIFIYAFPHDVLAAIVFTAYEGMIKRFKIVLSDMNFNIGNRMADTFIEFREYGINYSINKRHIPKDRVTLLPLYPYYNSAISFRGFPFSSLDGKKIVFSGGGTHKIEDPNRVYLNLVEKMLKYPDIVFLYAGYSDKIPDNGLIDLKNKYPGRVELQPERDDLFRIMENSDFYLDTYPIAGGLMVNFALAADTVPLSLTVDCKVLSNSNALIEDIYFSDIDELMREFERLYLDKNYYNERKEKIRGAFMSQEEYEAKLQNIISNNLQNGDFQYDDFEKEFLSMQKVHMKDFSYEYFVRHIICSDNYWELRNILFFYFIRRRVSNLIGMLK